MPLWGIVLLGLAAWIVTSVVLGVVIGRAVRIADARRSDQEFVRQVSRRALPVRRAPHTEDGSGTAERPAASAQPSRDVRPAARLIAGRAGG